MSCLVHSFPEPFQFKGLCDPSKSPVQTDLNPTKKEKRWNNKQRTKKDMQQRGRGALSIVEKGGRARTYSPQEISVNSLQKLRADKPLHWRKEEGQLSKQTFSKQRLQN
jgi:hypothetical protein